jgi:arabinofuranosyltransferase
MGTLFNRRSLCAVLVFMTAAAVLAILRAWLTDDAFISFRYARNLVEGHGLVYNPGERVEGYSNFLWTLWCALGLWMHIPAGLWAQIWGVVFYAASVGLLSIHLMALRPRSWSIQLALALTVLMAVLHPPEASGGTGWPVELWPWPA